LYRVASPFGRAICVGRCAIAQIDKILDIGAKPFFGDPESRRLSQASGSMFCKKVSHRP